MARFGSNAKPPLERTGFWALFWMALDDLMLKILIVAAIVSMVIEMVFEKDHRATGKLGNGSVDRRCSYFSSSVDCHLCHSME